MPYKPKTACAHPGCPELTHERFCGGHAQEERRADREYDRRRGSAHQRGYGAKWRKKRKQVLLDEPLCRTCKAAGRVTPTTDVDHIVSRSRGGTDERSNLQGLCHSCHSAKTNTEDGGAWR